MSGDILIPLPPEKIPAFKKPRWSYFIVTNRLGSPPMIKAQGEWVQVTIDGQPVNTPEPDPTLDMEIFFNPLNPLHLAAFGAFDAAIKEEYAKRQG